MIDQKLPRQFDRILSNMCECHFRTGIMSYFGNDIIISDYKLRVPTIHRGKTMFFSPILKNLFNT